MPGSLAPQVKDSLVGLWRRSLPMAVGDLVVAAQSMGAFTAVPVCEQLSARRLVLLNAMVPLPGEKAGDWWEHTGALGARRAAARAGGYPEQFDLHSYFLHDVPPEVLAEGPEQQRDEAEIAFEEPCPFARWLDIPTTVLAGRDDRFFPFAFQQHVARERLDGEAHPLPGGHLAALSQPGAVARDCYRPSRQSKTTCQAGGSASGRRRPHGDCLKQNTLARLAENTGANLSPPTS